MFSIGSKVSFTIRSTRTDPPQRVEIPGVVVSEGQIGTRPSRNPGVNIRSMIYEVISLRQRADGGWYLRTSFEDANFLSPRQTTLRGIDTDGEGNAVTLPRLMAAAQAGLQAYLQERDEQRATQLAVPDAEDIGELLPA